MSPTKRRSNALELGSILAFSGAGYAQATRMESELFEMFQFNLVKKE